MNVQVQNDPAFDTTVIFSAALRFGGLRPRWRTGGQAVYDRMADPIVRTHNIAVLAEQSFSRDPATDPDTGLPITVIHVKNDAPPGGDGSFESPLNEVRPAARRAGPNGIILVQRGDGTSTNMDQGIVLQDNQRLLGDSLAYTFESREVGTCPLPNQMTGRPVITNAAGSAVILANGNEVAGFTMAGASANGILGIDASGFNIHDNVIQSSGANGIFLNNASGQGTIVANTITANTSNGIRIINDAGVLAVTIAGNLITMNGTVPGTAVDNNGIFLSTAGSGNMTVTITGNAITLNGQGGSTLNGDNGIFLLTSEASQMTAMITGNNISNNGSVASPFGDNGILMLTRDTSQLTAVVDGNTLADNFVDGLFLNVTDSSRVVIGIRNNTFSGGTGFGARGQALGAAAEVCMQLLNNTSTTGFSLTGLGGATFDVEDTLATNTPAPATAGVTIVPFGFCGVP